MVHLRPALPYGNNDRSYLLIPRVSLGMRPNIAKQSTPDGIRRRIKPPNFSVADTTGGYLRGAIWTACLCSLSIARTLGEAVMPSEPVGW